MFNVSRKVLLWLALGAIALLIVSLAAGFFAGWLLAAIIGIYVAVAMIKQRSNPLV